jgi:hypothetical protein
MNHLLFHCHITVYMWNVIKDGLGWPNIPKRETDMNDNFY